MGSNLPGHRLEWPRDADGHSATLDLGFAGCAILVRPGTVLSRRELQQVASTKGAFVSHDRRRGILIVAPIAWDSDAAALNALSAGFGVIREYLRRLGVEIISGRSIAISPPD